MMLIRFISISFLLIAHLLLNSMENNLESKEPLFTFLPRDIILKIFACTDLTTKHPFSLTCLSLYSLESKDILKYSPLVLSRKSHLCHMVKTAQSNDTETFMNLLYNADNCNHTDIYDTVSYFLSPSSNVKEQMLPNIMAVYKGDESMLQEYMKTTKTEYTTAGIHLHLAAHKQHPIAIAELFLLHNPSLLNFKYDIGTPLFFAVMADNVEMCKFLLSFKEIDLEVSNNDLTPLLMAVDTDNIHITSLLINHIKDSNQIEKILHKEDRPLNRTPWYIAIQRGNTDILQLLLTAMDFKVFHTTQPLHVAIEYNQLGVAKMLLGHPHTQIDAQDEDGFTALHIAAHEGNIDAATLLLNHKADVLIASPNGYTPLHIATCKEHIPIIQLLLDHKVDINSASKEYLITPLMLAVEKNNYALCEFLLHNGAHVHATDSCGWSPLLIAAEEGCLNILALLLKHGANINHQTHDNQTALSIAIKQSQASIIAFLLNHPAILISDKENDLLMEFIYSDAKRS